MTSLSGMRINWDPGAFHNVSPRGGGTPTQKWRGDHRKFLKEPLRGTRILFCECGLNNFLPLRSRGTKSVDGHYTSYQNIYKCSLAKI